MFHQFLWFSSMNEMDRRKRDNCGSNIRSLMMKSTTTLFVLVILFSSSSLNVFALNYSTQYYKPVNSFRLARIERHLSKINKPPIKTIQSPDGDIIDCVQRHKQPALDHPLLKDHKIQRVPSSMPKRKEETKRVEEESEVMMKRRSSSDNVNGSSSSSSSHAWQTWHQSGERCPKGTVPIRRSSVNDVLRAKSLYHYGKKQSRRSSVSLDRRVDAPDVVSGNGHEHAIAYTGASEEVYGAKATINVWDPSIEVGNEFSLSQIWVLSGSFDSDLNSIEAGWQVSPELYGDNRPRLFTYWTSDAYQETGCYNLLCSGFVQINHEIAIGASISPVSSMSSNQFDITILIWKDPKVGNWWMRFGEDTLVGYWPARLFTHLTDRATMVEWGGEVVNSRLSGRHTSTHMGSGQFAEEGFGRASYFRNLEVVDADNSLSSVAEVSTLAENTNCYDIKSFYSNDWGTYFYYGGPGNNPQCT
ncbi:hypothetical protein Syun_030070 [Stephania yunnanensis]|uniref:Neprosin PEP catalytic domain-containing protein n=1 Tax=Stephania yunnanensis TaxID=152371 RepID=A0AAP0HKF9_9MAGN